MGKQALILGFLVLSTAASAVEDLTTAPVPDTEAMVPVATVESPSTPMQNQVQVPTANPDFVPELLDRSSLIGSLDKVDPTTRLAGEGDAPVTNGPSGPPEGTPPARYPASEAAPGTPQPGNTVQ